MQNAECGMRSEETRRRRAVHSTLCTPRSALPGFTLLEAALALSLSLALVAAMLAFYRQIVQVRTAVTSEVAFIRMERSVMGQMTAELRGAVTLGSGLSGGEDQVRMAVPTLPGPAVWAERNITEEPLPAEDDLMRVGYRLRVEEDESGNSVIVGLERTEQKLLEAKVVVEGVQVRATLIAPEIKFLYLQYWDGTGWVPDWGDSNLPLAVEIVLGTEPLPENTEPDEYPFETFNRVVYLPAASRPAEQGTVIRGLGEGGLP